MKGEVDLEMTTQRITAISVTPIPTRYPHEIARNAYNWGHGSNGSYAVADAPGLGLAVDEDIFQNIYAVNETKIRA